MFLPFHDPILRIPRQLLAERTVCGQINLLARQTAVHVATVDDIVTLAAGENSDDVGWLGRTVPAVFQVGQHSRLGAMAADPGKAHATKLAVGELAEVSHGALSIAVTPDTSRR